MNDAERRSYERQFDQARRRLPRGHVISHCTWRDGQLITRSARPERQAREPEFQPRVRRGVQAGLFD